MRDGQRCDAERKDRGPRVQNGGNERDAQMVAQHPRAENAQGEEVAAQAGVAAEKAGDSLVAIFCVVHQSVFRTVSLGALYGLTISSDDVPCRRIESYRR